MNRRRSNGRPACPVAAEKVRELREKGLSFRQIAKTTGFGYGTVRRAYHKGSVAQRSESGHTTPPHAGRMPGVDQPTY